MGMIDQLKEREEQNRPVRIGMIGGGKFGTMFMAQAQRIPGVHVLGVVDLDVEQARSNFILTGWPKERLMAPTLDTALQTQATHISDNVEDLINHPAIEIIIECTGNPIVIMIPQGSCRSLKRSQSGLLMIC